MKRCMSSTAEKAICVDIWPGEHSGRGGGKGTNLTRIVILSPPSEQSVFMFLSDHRRTILVDFVSSTSCPITPS